MLVLFLQPWLCLLKLFTAGSYRKFRYKKFSNDIASIILAWSVQIVGRIATRDIASFSSLISYSFLTQALILYESCQGTINLERYLIRWDLFGWANIHWYSETCRNQTSISKGHVFWNRLNNNQIVTEKPDNTKRIIFLQQLRILPA